MHRLKSLLAVVAAMLTAASVWAMEGPRPKPAHRSVTADGGIRLRPTDRCPVCAMFPARHARSAAAMTLVNGHTYYFCSNGCLLRSWLRPSAYLGISRKTIDRMVVQDYFSGRPTDARTAIWIAGSDVAGPMGPAIVALGDAAQQDAFVRRHGGQTIFTFDQIDDRLWLQISHRKLPEKKTP